MSSNPRSSRDLSVHTKSSATSQLAKRKQNEQRAKEEEEQERAIRERKGEFKKQLKSLIGESTAHGIPSTVSSSNKR